MKKTLLLRSLGVVTSLFAALTLSACDDGSSAGTGGAGGSGSGSGKASSTSTSTSTGSNTGSSSSGGTNLTLSMIDDMEDMDGSILSAEGRQGAWYVYNDASPAGMQTPMVDPKGMTPFPMSATSRGASKFAANTHGMGFTVWGAGFGFDLNNSGGMNPVKSPYDASAYKGIHFYAKIGSGAIGAVRFNVGDVNTTPEGGKCTTGGMMPTCSDDFGQNLNLTTDWQDITIAFSDMKQVGWAMQKLPSIDTKSLYSVHFQAGTKTSFDIWIDDIAFYK